MMSNISILAHEYCTGCGMCSNLCPQNAIVMSPDEEGFLFPKINSNCVNCGLCAKHCPVLSQSFEKNSSVTGCFAAQGNDDDRFASGSGAAFKIIAESVLKDGGVVCGAAFNSDFTEVEHQVVTKSKLLPALMKSKYVQSNTGHIYTQIKGYLDRGILTLFSGCPCQVAALKRFLNKDYANLLTIDLLCHGVPSPMAYKIFLMEKNPGKKPIISVDFRDKAYGWGKHITIKYADGEICNEP